MEASVASAGMDVSAPWVEAHPYLATAAAQLFDDLLVEGMDPMRLRRLLCTRLARNLLGSLAAEDAWHPYEDPLTADVVPTGAEARSPAPYPGGALPPPSSHVETGARQLATGPEPNIAPVPPPPPGAMRDPRVQQAEGLWAPPLLRPLP